MRFHCFVINTLLLVAVAASTVVADEGDGPTKLVLYPAAEASPALRYQLLPSILEQRSGNAAVYYGKVTAEQMQFFTNKELWQRIYDLVDMPIDKIEIGDREKVLLADNSIFRYLEDAARCETCDWQLPIRDESYFRILLPEVQQSRSYGRLLAARTRLQIAQGDYDGALRSLQSGYALARNVSDSPTIISSLVGIANAQMMAHQLRTWSQQPNSPNLYWALSSLPRPLTRWDKGLAAERQALYLSFPALRNVEQMDRSDAYWREALHKLWGEISEYIDMNSTQPRATLTLLVLRSYPLAKKALIESGMEAKQVEKMPVAQVVLLHSMREFNKIRDEQFKWAYAPFPRASVELKRLNVELRTLSKRSDVLPFAGVLLPAMEAVIRATTRADREIAVLRTMEAIRMYAAEHDGQLPKSLSDCPVPAPIDPVTGKVFAYKKQGNVATLTGPELPGSPLNYEIRIARP